VPQRFAVEQRVEAGLFVTHGSPRMVGRIE
jgi:hypothetical protein